MAFYINLYKREGVTEININEKPFDFGNRLKELRVARGLTQEDVAYKLELHKNTISGYENNIIEPPIKTLMKLSHIYGTSIDYLLGNTSQETIIIDDLPSYEQNLIRKIINTIREEHIKSN